MKKTIIIIIILMFLSATFYQVYMMRSKSVYGIWIEEVKQSPILNKKFGKIEEVKMNNFLSWSSKKKGYKCVKMQVITKEEKYNICKVISQEEYIYIVNDKIYEDIYSLSNFIILEDREVNFYDDFENYFINNLRSDEERLKYSRLIKNNDNTFKYSTNCEYEQEDKCAEKNRKLLDEIIKSIGNNYSYSLTGEIEIINNN